MNDQTEAVATIEAQPVAPSAPPSPAPARTATDMRVVEVSEALAPAYAKASTLELTDEEVAKLTAPFPDSAVAIRPHDGLCWIPHIHISDRLNQVFGPGKWALICRRHWIEGVTLYGEYVLLIRGVFIGESVGGHNYVPSNPKTNYSDSLEATAAEALRRICGKRLSCGSQVWNPEYAERWVSTYAEQVHGKWRKKAIPAAAKAPPARPEPQTTSPPPPAAKTPPAAPTTPQQRKELLIEKCRGMEAAATAVMLEEGLILPTEEFSDIGLTTIERMAPDNMLALLKQIRQRQAEWADVPSEEPPDDPGESAPAPRSWESGILPFNSPKNPAAKKGMTLKELFENPETSKFAFGLAMNFVAEPYKGNPPSAEEVAFAEACRQWRIEHGKEKA